MPYQKDKSLPERLKHLVGNSLHSDFTFILEDNVEIPAHTLIIGAASPVLDKIVYGTGTFSPEISAFVDSISKESFMEMLRYMYTDNININDDNVLEILHKATYFELTGIETKCFEYLKEHLKPSIVGRAYHQLFNCYPPNELLKRCLQMIRIYPIAFFEAVDFTQLSVDEFKLIVETDAINCNEIDLFESTLKLAKAHCAVYGLEPTAANQRKVLNEAEKLLRLDTMTKTELDYCLKMQPDFFSSSEIERFYAVIEKKVPTTTPKRQRYTFRGKFY